MAAINGKELAVLAEYRNLIADLRLTSLQQSDHFLIRWIRAREYNLEKAKALLSNYLQNREKEDVDNILSWEPPSMVKTLGPYQMLGFDNENCPVVYLPIGIWNCRKLAELGLCQDVVRYVDKMYEEAECLMAGKKTPEGLPVTQYVLIVDTDKLSMLQFTNLQVVDTILQVVRKFEAYHPETAKKIFIANAGRAFHAFYSLAKPILAQKTIAKIRIFRSNDEQCIMELLKDIPAQILPRKLGGSSVEAEAVGNAGKEDEDEDELVFMTVSVPAGDKLTLSYGVSQGNSTISWAFKTDKYDISFGVTRDGKAYIENKRVDSHMDMQEGNITCDQPGDYIFSFDNSYSRLRSKALSYRIDVKYP